MGIPSTQPAGSNASGYTRIVSWKQRISVVALVVLAAVPVSRVLCGMVCGLSAETSSSHHGRASQPCGEPAPSSTGVHIEGLPEHDCSAHGGAVPYLATPAPERMGVHIAQVLSVTPTRNPTFDRAPTVAPALECSRPPGLAPPTIPLVLRV
jgi:hypothetical protein